MLLSSQLSKRLDVGPAPFSLFPPPLPPPYIHSRWMHVNDDEDDDKVRTKVAGWGQRGREKEERE